MRSCLRGVQFDQNLGTTSLGTVTVGGILSIHGCASSRIKFPIHMSGWLRFCGGQGHNKRHVIVGTIDPEGHKCTNMPVST